MNGAPDKPVTNGTMHDMQVKFEELRTSFEAVQDRSDIKNIRTHQQGLADLMLEQAADQKKRRKLITYALGVVLAGGGASFGGYKLVLEETAQAEIKPAEIRTRVEKVEKDVGSLRKAAIDQQVQLVDSLDYIVGKIDSAHPDAPAVEEPATLKAARRKTARDKAERTLFQDEPFSE